MQFRRVVTGHDANGRAIVTIDDAGGKMVTPRPGAHSHLIWTTEGFPVNMDDEDDGGTRDIGTYIRNGSVFRVGVYEPGVVSRRHRSETIDYAIILSGEIDMELDDCEVHLTAGDVVVQRGTIHNWENRGSEPCVIAFILIAAEPARVGAELLLDEG